MSQVFSETHSDCIPDGMKLILFPPTPAAQDKLCDRIYLVGRARLKPARVMEDIPRMTWE